VRESFATARPKQRVMSPGMLLLVGADDRAEESKAKRQ
jgi:hypothetical protein